MCENCFKFLKGKSCFRQSWPPDESGWGGRSSRPPSVLTAVFPLRVLWLICLHSPLLEVFGSRTRARVWNMSLLAKLYLWVLLVCPCGGSRHCCLPSGRQRVCGLPDIVSSKCWSRGATLLYVELASLEFCFYQGELNAGLGAPSKCCIIFL